MMLSGSNPTSLRNVLLRRKYSIASNRRPTFIVANVNDSVESELFSSILRKLKDVKPRSLNIFKRSKAPKKIVIHECRKTNNELERWNFNLPVFDEISRLDGVIFVWDQSIHDSNFNVIDESGNETDKFMFEFDKRLIKPTSACPILIIIKSIQEKPSSKEEWRECVRNLSHYNWLRNAICNIKEICMVHIWSNNNDSEINRGLKWILKLSAKMKKGNIFRDVILSNPELNARISNSMTKIVVKRSGPRLPRTISDDCIIRSKKYESMLKDLSEWKTNAKREKLERRRGSHERNRVAKKPKTGRNKATEPQRSKSNILTRENAPAGAIIEKRNTVSSARRRARKLVSQVLKSFLESMKICISEERAHLVLAGIYEAQNFESHPLERCLCVSYTPLVEIEDGRVRQIQINIQDLFTGLQQESVVTLTGSLQVGGITLGEFNKIASEPQLNFNRNARVLASLNTP